MNTYSPQMAETNKKLDEIVTVLKQIAATLDDLKTDAYIRDLMSRRESVLEDADT